MGLLDQLTGALAGSDKGNGSVNYVALIKWIEQSGGISGLLDKFRQGGLGDIVQSWMGSGNSLPISADQVQKVLSNDMLKDLSSKLGMDSAATSGIIAQYLPQIVSKLAVDGKEPKNSDLASIGMNFLKNKFLGK